MGDDNTPNDADDDSKADLTHIALMPNLAAELQKAAANEGTSAEDAAAWDEEVSGGHTTVAMSPFVAGANESAQPGHGDVSLDAAAAATGILPGAAAKGRPLPPEEGDAANAASSAVAPVWAGASDSGSAEAAAQSSASDAAAKPQFETRVRMVGATGVLGDELWQKMWGPLLCAWRELPGVSRGLTAFFILSFFGSGLALGWMLASGARSDAGVSLQPVAMIQNRGQNKAKTGEAWQNAGASAREALEASASPRKKEAVVDAEVQAGNDTAKLEAEVRKAASKAARFQGLDDEDDSEAALDLGGEDAIEAQAAQQKLRHAFFEEYGVEAYGKAVTLGLQLEELYGLDLDAEYFLAHGYRLAKDADRAFARFERFARRHAHHRFADDAYFWMGEILHGQDQTQDARRYFERAAKMPGSNMAEAAGRRLQLQ